MSVKLQHHLKTLHTVLTQRGHPQTVDESLCLTADALRQTFGETRFLFYLASPDPTVDPLSLVPCPARQLTPGVFVYESSKKAVQFTFETDQPYHTPIASKVATYGILFLEILGQPPDELEQYFIGLLATQTANYLEGGGRLKEPGEGNLGGLPKLIIDRAANRVWINGSPLKLKGKELAVLELLSAHRDQICSQALIYQAVYADEVIPTAGQGHRLAQLIYRLKQKLQAIEGNPVRIETVYGQGYRLRLSWTGGTGQKSEHSA